MLKNFYMTNKVCIRILYETLLSVRNKLQMALDYGVIMEADKPKLTLCKSSMMGSC
jgi:hypothetical protein